MSTELKTLSATQILGPKAVDLIIQAAEGESMAWWIYGRVAVDVVDGRDPEVITITQIYQAIADLTPDRGQESIRKLAAMARFYPQAVVDGYPELTAGHFMAAMWGHSLDQAMYWLNVARESADHYGGRPMPVRILAAKIGAATGQQPIDNTTPYEQLDALYHAANRAAAALQARGMPNWLVGQILSLSSRLQGILIQAAADQDLQLQDGACWGWAITHTAHWYSPVPSDPGMYRSACGHDQDRPLVAPKAMARCPECEAQIRRWQDG